MFAGSLKPSQDRLSATAPGAGTGRMMLFVGAKYHCFFCADGIVRSAVIDDRLTFGGPTNETVT
jgi:hypothetical protein